MPLLSLGLLNDEREDVGREDGAASHPTQVGQAARLSAPDESRAASTVGLLDLRTEDTHEPELRSSRTGEPPVPSEPERRTGEPVPRELSQLPDAIEELRLRVSGNELPKATVWGARKGASPTEYLTVADRR